MGGVPEGGGGRGGGYGETDSEADCEIDIHTNAGAEGETPALRESIALGLLASCRRQRTKRSPSGPVGHVLQLLCSEEELLQRTAITVWL